MNEVNFVIVSTESKREQETECTNAKLCAMCKGYYCCQNCGCSYSPEDFYVLTHPFSEEERLKYIISFLKRGYASIDHKRLLERQYGAFSWDSIYSMRYPSDVKNLRISLSKLLHCDGALYLRAPNIGQGPVDVIHSYVLGPDTGCALWTKESGCPLSYRKRPKGGRLLIPREDFDCEEKYTELQAAKDWRPYQTLLYKAYEYFMNNEEMKK